MRKKRSLIAAAVLCVALLGACGVDGAPAPSPTPVVPPIESTLPPDALLTVDGYAVPEEEFLIFLMDQRALTAAHFSSAYGAEMDGDFWRREYGGQTPDDYAKHAALEQLVAAKIEAILLHERALLEDVSYAALRKDMEKTNAERAQKQENGEVFYGLTEYDPATYYAYVRANRWEELVRSQAGRYTPTSAELRRIYEENSARYQGETTYTCSITHEDGTVESRTLSLSTANKEDMAAVALLDALAKIEPGSQLTEVPLDGGTVTVALIAADTAPMATFESVQSDLMGQYEETALWALVTERRQSAVLAFNQARYDALTLG